MKLLSNLAPRRMIIIGASMLAGAAIVALPGTASAATHGDYVALGDSYSAGTGSGVYLNAGCQRTAQSYPYLYAEKYAPATFVDRACGGATTTTVLQKQLSSVSQGTDLVTITVGGNDIGFADTMLACTLRGDHGCAAAVAAAERVANKELPGRLDEVFDQIRARAPRARVVVLGYPHLYATDPAASCWLVSPASQQLVNDGVDVLNMALRAAAGRGRVQYVDVAAFFDGHGSCDSTAPYVAGINFDALSASYRPTVAGQYAGYFRALQLATH